MCCSRSLVKHWLFGTQAAHVIVRRLLTKQENHENHLDETNVYKCMESLDSPSQGVKCHDHMQVHEACYLHMNSEIGTDPRVWEMGRMLQVTRLRVRRDLQTGTKRTKRTKLPSHHPKGSYVLVFFGIERSPARCRNNLVDLGCSQPGGILFP